MKSIIALAVLSIVSLTVEANTLDFSSLIGSYTLLKTEAGSCAPQLNIEAEDFGNQRAAHSLGIYGVNGEPETAIIYQLTNLNAGVDFHYTTNPMFGQVDGSWYDVETFENNKMTAETTVKNIFGKILWKTTLNALIDKNNVSFTRTDYNILSGHTEYRVDTCRYIKN